MSDMPHKPPVWEASLRFDASMSEEDVRASTDWLLALGKRYTKLVAHLDAIRASGGNASWKSAAAVLAFVEFLSADDALPDGVVLPVLQLLDKTPAKAYGDVARGIIAAGVATLRHAGLKGHKIKAPLDEAINSSGLDVTADYAIRQYNNCNEGGATAATMEAFSIFRPDETQAMTVVEAQRKVTRALEIVRRLHPAPLKEKRRRSS